jgi:hypothetical protein
MVREGAGVVAAAVRPDRSGRASGTTSWQSDILRERKLLIFTWRPIVAIAGQWQSLTDLKLAPFHLLASEGTVHSAKDHVWHMEILGRICQADPALMLATPFRVIDLTDPVISREESPGGRNLRLAAARGWWCNPSSSSRKDKKDMHNPRSKCAVVNICESSMVRSTRFRKT